jgi:uncharacterized protein involved in tolerance to divalent cations
MKAEETFCVFMSGGHNTYLIINRKLSARLHKHAVISSFYLWKQYIFNQKELNPNIARLA